MKKGIKKEVFTYIALFAVLALVAVYFLGYKKMVAKTEALKTTNASLAATVEELKVYKINEAQYLADMVPMKEQITNVLNMYPADIRPEDMIMQAVNTQSKTEVAISSINIGQKKDLKVIPADMVKALGNEALQQDIVFCESQSTYSNQLTYESLKDVVKILHECPYNIGITSLTYSKAGGDKLSGTISLSFYSMRGNGKEYNAPAMLPYLSGTYNIFGILPTPEEEDAAQ